MRKKKEKKIKEKKNKKVKHLDVYINRSSPGFELQSVPN